MNLKGQRIQTDDLATGAVTSAKCDVSVATAVGLTAAVAAAVAAAPAQAVAQAPFASITGLGALPIWVRYDITPAELATLGASTTGTLSPSALVVPKGTVIHLAAMVTSTAFTGTSLSALKVEVGDTGTANQYFPTSQSIFATGSAIGTTANFPVPYAAADQIKLAFTATGANLNVADMAGLASLYLLCSALG